MAKGQFKESGSRKQAHDVSDVDAAALQAEVKAFASGLGLAAAGVSSGFDDSDFRPPASSHKNSLVGANHTSSAQPDAQKGKKKRRGVKPAATKPEPAQEQPEVPDIVRERNWNAGVGPRPGQFPC